MFVTALFTIARKQEQPKCPSANELIIAGYNPIREIGKVHLREGEGSKYRMREVGKMTIRISDKSVMNHY